MQQYPNYSAMLTLATVLTRTIGGFTMLSFLYHLAHDFELSHGYQANLLYINQQHFDALRQQLTEIDDLAKLTQFLGMDIVISDEATHPHIVWQPIEWTKITA